LAIIFLNQEHKNCTTQKSLTNRPGRSPHCTGPQLPGRALRTALARSAPPPSHCTLCRLRPTHLALGRRCRPCKTLALGHHGHSYETLALGCRCRPYKTLALGRHYNRNFHVLSINFC